MSNKKLTFYLQPVLYKSLRAIQRRMGMKFTPLMQLIVAEFVDNHKDIVEAGEKMLKADAELQRQMDEDADSGLFTTVQKLQDSIREASKKRRR